MDDDLENTSELEENVTKFLDVGCECSGGPEGGPCSQIFSKETVLFNLNNCLELSTAELDVVILANIQASTHGLNDKVGEKRSRRPRCDFTFKSIPICKKMFFHLYGISDSRFRSLKEQYEIHGIAPRVHGNTNKLPSNTHSQSVIEDITTFISNYVEENARMISSCYLLLKPKPAFGGNTMQVANLRKKLLYATRPFLTYGISFSRTSLWPSL